MNEVSEYELLPKTTRPEEVKLARQVISTFESELDLRNTSDEYQAELRRIIDAKIAGEEVVAKEEEAPAKVVNLMEALRKSLESVSENKKKPAKADLSQDHARPRLPRPRSARRA